MSAPMGRLQFFALEASDYLERLAGIVDRSTAPEAEELVRLTRALRGAALMAGLPAYAQAAAGLEQVAKAHRDDPAAWTPERRGVVAEAVATFKTLTSQAATWSDQNAEQAVALGRSIAASVGGEPPPSRQAAASGPDSDELKPSVRAFVGREGAVIAGTLEHAAQALELLQPAKAAEVVLSRLQPLRGLATLPSLSPLPEFLDAIELTIRSVQGHNAPPNGALALRRAAVAVTRLAREIAEGTAAEADTPEVVLGAVSLLEAFGNEDDVVEIGSLFHADDPTPIVSLSEHELVETGPDMIELVSLSDRLRQAADQLTAPTSATGRMLSLYAVLVQLRPLTQAAPRERPYLAGLLQEIAAAIGQGRGGRAPAEFGIALRQAAEVLTEAATNRNVVFLRDELDPIAATIRVLGATPLVTQKPDPAASPEEPVVPIESLAHSQNAFEQSFSTYHRLTRPEPQPEPVATTATADDADIDVVDIDRLLFRGRRALQEADRVSRKLSLAMEAARPFREIEPLVSELIDLVPLALAE